MTRQLNEQELVSRDTQWREELRKSLTTKERTAMPRVTMPELDATYRIHTNEEVNQGLSIEQAVIESRRCLDCPDPGCMKGCPVSNHIPAFIKNIERRHFAEALDVLSLTTVLPAVCGRVCPQEKQCEAGCIYNKMKKQPVAIGHLERFVADFNREVERQTMPDGRNEPAAPLGSPFFAGIKIAVVGSGPSGLAFAGDMAKRGYDVTVFEALDRLGGVLKYGIPEFCLPKDVVNAEIAKVAALGVKFEKNCFVGTTMPYDELTARGFKGIYVATGAGKPRFMGIPGENLPGVMTANEYLIRYNLVRHEIYGQNVMSLHRKRVAVIGAGNTAMDAVRAALRMGAEKAMIVYRRSEEEIPARADEMRHAKEEGVEFLTLHNPVEYLADENGMLRSMRLQKMTLGEPDESGRRKPVEIPNAIEEIPVDIVVVCVGYLPNPPELTDELDISKKGEIVVDEKSGKSSKPSIYAGGDIVRGAATVILAMGDGRRAAKSMSDAFARIISNTSLG
ncbi:MAG: FAD-dependent oxidoreductase [Muribaculaceae bacterium]|nr:FAD-dependent oxidoreductase [Muribaculaceae bacterium]